MYAAQAVSPRLDGEYDMIVCFTSHGPYPPPAVQGGMQNIEFS